MRVGDNGVMTSTTPPPGASDGSDDPDEVVEITRQEVTVRRSPRYWRIMALGAGIGAVLAFVLTFALPGTPEYSQGQVFGFSLLVLVVVFGAVAALVALLLDRVVGRRTTSFEAERVHVETLHPGAAPIAPETVAPTPLSPIYSDLGGVGQSSRAPQPQPQQPQQAEPAAEPAPESDTRPPTV